MSQRNSGYERQKDDAYYTPEWVTKALIPHIPSWVKYIWEPACGSGKMMNALFSGTKASVIGTDIQGQDSHDFLKENSTMFDAIITNPPFKLSRKFIEHALELTKEKRGFVPSDYDHAKTRQHLFKNCPQFSKRLVLTRRIVWFERDDGTDNPSGNHSWWIWNWRWSLSLPAIEYYVEP